jgi:hypothetical protein
VLKDIISARLRKPIYAAYAVVVLAEGATQVGYATADAGTPTWLKVAIAVTSFIGAGVGFTAAANTTVPPEA